MILRMAQCVSWLHPEKFTYSLQLGISIFRKAIPHPAHLGPPLGRIPAASSSAGGAGEAVLTALLRVLLPTQEGQKGEGGKQRRESQC